jgi:hypothetical protein
VTRPPSRGVRAARVLGALLTVGGIAYAISHRIGPMPGGRQRAGATARHATDGAVAGRPAEAAPTRTTPSTGATFLMARWAPDENPEGGVVFDPLPVRSRAEADASARHRGGYVRADGPGGGAVWPYSVLVRLDADAPARLDAGSAGVRLPAKARPIR